jgi:glycosyltransferase involved in cell wall biosynthesis
VGIPERKIIQIINGVDAEKYKPDGNKKEARARIGIPQDVLVIGTVGRLDPVKDQRTLIKAFGLLTRARNKANLSKDLRLLIIGSGSNQRELKTVAHKEGVVDKVFFLGERNDVPELLQVMDVFVLPSIAEGISNTILEAMACGLPVIATTIGGNPEVIDDGKTGLLFKPGDHDRLAHLLARYCDDPFLRNNHGANGRARVEDNFSLSRMVREYDELYRTCGASFLQ